MEGTYKIPHEQIEDYSITDILGLSDALTSLSTNKEDRINKQNSLAFDPTDLLYPTVTAVKEGLSLKQETLVSTVNIKSLNNISLLGSGNIDIIVPTIYNATPTQEGVIKLAGDLSGTYDAPTVPGLATKEPTIVGGATTQYWRGDKTWQLLNKAAVGLGNVDNTSDINKPISSATQVALNLKADLTYVDSQDSAISATVNAHIADLNNPHQTTATKTPATPHSNHLLGANVQLQLDQSETEFVTGNKIDKINAKTQFQTGIVRPDSDVSVLTISPADSLTITACNNILFVNNILPDTPSNKISDSIFSFGNKVFVANGTNTSLPANTRGIFYVGLDKLGVQVYRPARIYDTDVCYLARLVVQNSAGTYTIVSAKYFPDLAYNSPIEKDRTVAATGQLAWSGAASISFGHKGVSFTRNSVNYSVNKLDPNYLTVPDTVNTTPMNFLFMVPNLTSLATNISPITTINPTQWFQADGTVGGSAIANTSYQVYRLLVSVTGTMIIQVIASTTNTPQFGVNGIFGNRDDALAGLSSVVFPDLLPAGDAIVLGKFFLRAGTNANGSGMTDPNDFYFQPTTATSSSSSVGVTDHDSLSGKNSNPTYQHVTTGQISSWDAKQAALLGTGVVKSNAGVISYHPDNTANWDTAFSERRQWDGGALNLNAATGRTSLGGSVVGQNIFTLPNPSAVTFLRMNVDNTVSALDSASFRAAIGAGTVSSVAPLNIGSAGNDLSSSVATGATTPIITLNVPTASASARGVLSAADWARFNAKQDAIVNAVTGSGSANYVARWTGPNIQSTGKLYDDGTSVGINTNSPEVGMVFDAAGTVALGAVAGNSRLYVGSGPGYTIVQARNLSVPTQMRYYGSSHAFDTDVYANSFNGSGAGLTGYAPNFSVGYSSMVKNNAVSSGNTNVMMEETAPGAMSWRDAYNSTNGLSGWWNYTTQRHSNSGASYGTQMAISWDGPNSMKFRSVYNNAWTNWATVISDETISSYALRKGNDTNGGTYSLYSNDASGTYNTRAIELREVGLTSSNNSGNPAYAPSLGFHWSGVTQNQIILRNSGVLAIRSSGGGSDWGSAILHENNYYNYALPLSGGSIDGLLNIRPNVGNYAEGIRIGNHSGWSNIQFGTDGTTSGNNADGKQWLVGKHPNGNFTIVPGGQEGTAANGLVLFKNANAWWYGNTLLHSGNYKGFSLPQSTPSDLDVNDTLGMGTGLFRGSTQNWTNQPPHGHNGNALLNIDTHPGNYFSQLWFDTGNGRILHRVANAGALGNWDTILASNNFNNYSPTLTGGNASGSWRIQVRGIDNTYANSLLASGAGRADDASGSTWIFADSAVSESGAWGIKHNQLENLIEFYSVGARRSYIDLQNGYFNGNVNGNLNGTSTYADLLNPINGDPNYKLAFSADGSRDNAGEWGRVVMRYSPNGQKYGVRVDRADYSDNSGYSRYFTTTFGANLETITEGGIYREEQPSSGFHYTATLNMNSSDGRQQLTVSRAGDNMKFRGNQNGSGGAGWSSWKQVLHNENYNYYSNFYQNVFVDAGYDSGFLLHDGFNITRQSGYTLFRYADRAQLQMDYSGLRVIGDRIDVMGNSYLYGGLSVGVGVRAGVLNNTNSIAIGDNDTGFRQNGDGVLEVVCNGSIVRRDYDSQCYQFTQLNLQNNNIVGVNNYYTNQYGSSLVGNYDSFRYQGVFAMGDAYKVPSDGTSLGNHYGLAWTHSNIGGQSKGFLGHQLLITNAGVTKTALGDGIWTTNKIVIGGINGDANGSGSGEGLKMDYLQNGRTSLTSLTSGSGYGLFYYQGAAGRDGIDSVDIAFNTTSAADSVMSVKTNGDVKVKGDIFAFASSDRRLKDNIVPIKDPIEKIKRISGNTFTWNEKQNSSVGDDIGVIADEIEEILPEIVVTRDTGYKAVKYDKLVPLLIEVEKASIIKIEALELKIKALELLVNSKLN